LDSPIVTYEESPLLTSRGDLLQDLNRLDIEVPEIRDPHHIGDEFYMNVLDKYTRFAGNQKGHSQGRGQRREASHLSNIRTEYFPDIDSKFEKIDSLFAEESSLSPVQTGLDSDFEPVFAEQRHVDSVSEPQGFTLVGILPHPGNHHPNPHFLRNNYILI
jgi:hypothetical protein